MFGYVMYDTNVCKEGAWESCCMPEPALLPFLTWTSLLHSQGHISHLPTSPLEGAVAPIPHTKFTSEYAVESVNTLYGLQLKGDSTHTHTDKQSEREIIKLHPKEYHSQGRCFQFWFGVFFWLLGVCCVVVGDVMFWFGFVVFIFFLNKTNLQGSNLLINSCYL